MAVNTTYMAKKEQVERKWFVVDATDKVLGRLAAQVALILQGKNKPAYGPSVDTGDLVVIVCAGRMEVAGMRRVKR